MNEITPRVLNHISLFAFTDGYWLLNQNAKASFHEHWQQALATAATNVDIYQSADSGTDLLVWCALNALQPSSTAEFFRRYAVTTGPFRHLIRPIDSIWGFTAPSPDAKARSAQEIDPLSATRLQYLMVYPFGSGRDWYSMSREARQEMMDKSTDIADRYEDVKQLVLYSTGLQGYESILLYETDDLEALSELTRELRDLEAGRFLRRARCAFTGIYHPAAETLSLWR